jgi:carbon-monoxide dehydrogenase medium subunit
MRPAAFEYFDPRTTDEALGLLDRFGDEAKVLAGGLSLVSLMKLRLAAPAYLIDIGRIPAFSYIEEHEDGGLRIGPLTTYRTIETSSLVRSRSPIVAETAGGIGDPQVRNRGTIGGNICHADPAGDYGPVVRALEAEFTAVSLDGQRVLSVDDFFLDVFTTPLEAGELMTEIKIPPMPPNTGQKFLKLTPRSGAAPIVSAAVVMTIENGNVCKSLRIALGAAGPTPARARESEQALIGEPVTVETIERAAAAVSSDIEPSSDIHASAGYRREMAAVVTRRALQEAFARAGGAQ